MIGDRKVLGVITARGGSKGLPRKNVLPVGGRPMVAWSVVAGLGSRYIDRLILSSNDDEIIAASRAAGCEVPFVRPDELSTDTARVQDAILHALDVLPETYDYVVMLPATSPLRLAEDIDGALELAERAGTPSVISVSPTGKNPHWMYRVDEGCRMAPLLDGATAYRRQDLPLVHALNGAIYVVRTQWFRETREFMAPETLAYIMPPERSVDVDARLDLVMADALMAERDSRNLD